MVRCIACRSAAAHRTPATRLHKPLTLSRVALLTIDTEQGKAFDEHRHHASGSLGPLRGIDGRRRFPRCYPFLRPGGHLHRRLPARSDESAAPPGRRAGGAEEGRPVHSRHDAPSAFPAPDGVVVVATMWTVARTYERAASPPDMDAWQDQLSGSEALVANASDSGITVTVHVQADSAQQAVLASSHVDEVVGQKPVGLEALTQDEHDRRARRTNLPELMSAADIAHHLGVTRQRVHQLRTTAQFPHPLAELRVGTVSGTELRSARSHAPGNANPAGPPPGNPPDDPALAVAWVAVRHPAWVAAPKRAGHRIAADGSTPERPAAQCYDPSQ